MKTRFKSIDGAARRVRELQRQVDELQTIVRAFDHERRLLARLAAEGPAFDNPLVAYDAKKIRNEILLTMGMNADGTFISK